MVLGKLYDISIRRRNNPFPSDSIDYLIEKIIYDKFGYLAVQFQTGIIGIVIIQLPSNQGHSVTTCFDYVAAEIYAKHYRGTYPHSLMWFEYWPKESRINGDTLDRAALEVLLSHPDGSVVFDTPVWQPVTDTTKFYKKIINLLRGLEYDS